MSKTEIQIMTYTIWSKLNTIEAENYSKDQQLSIIEEEVKKIYGAGIRLGVTKSLYELSSVRNNLENTYLK